MGDKHDRFCSNKEAIVLSRDLLRLFARQRRDAYSPLGANLERFRLVHSYYEVTLNSFKYSVKVLTGAQELT